MKTESETKKIVISSKRVTWQCMSCSRRCQITSSTSTPKSKICPLSLHRIEISVKQETSFDIFLKSLREIYLGCMNEIDEETFTLNTVKKLTRNNAYINKMSEVAKITIETIIWEFLSS